MNESEFLARLDRKIDYAIQLLRFIAYRELEMTAEMTRLISEVAANTDTEDSIELALTGIANQLKAAIAAGADPATLTKLADDLAASRRKMIDAITVNTPAATP